MAKAWYQVAVVSSLKDAREAIRDAKESARDTKNIYGEAIKKAKGAKSSADCSKALDISFQAINPLSNYLCRSSSVNTDLNPGIRLRPNGEEIEKLYDKSGLGKTDDRVLGLPRLARMAIQACLSKHR